MNKPKRSEGVIKLKKHLDGLDKLDSMLIIRDICNNCCISLPTFKNFIYGNARLHWLIIKEMERTVGKHFFEKEDTQVIPIKNYYTYK